MSKFYKIFILNICLLHFSLICSAQSDKEKKKGKPKRTTINFEDQLIKGERQMPDLLYMLRKKKFNYKRLIRLRDDFILEMEETAAEIKESGKNKKSK